MKKLCFLFALMLCFSLFSCSDQKEPVSETKEPNNTSVESETTEAETDEIISKDPPNYTYVVENGHAEIVWYSGDEKEVVIPEKIDGYTVKVIKDNAFYNKRAITSITLPVHLQKLENGCFYKCFSLEKMFIPKELTEMGPNPFFRTPSLQSITVEKENPAFCDIDGVLYTKDRKTLIAFPEGMETEEYTVPDGVVEIKEDAFAYKPIYLKTVYLPDTIESTQIGFVYPDEITFAIHDNTAIKEQLVNHGVKVIDINN